MDKIFVNFLPPWVETNIQPAFYDKESGSVLQQTARMYAKVQCLVRMFNKLSKETKETVDEYTTKFLELKDFVDTYFENLDVQEEINNKLDEMTEDGTLTNIIRDIVKYDEHSPFVARNFKDLVFADSDTYAGHDHGNVQGSVVIGDSIIVALRNAQFYDDYVRLVEYDMETGTTVREKYLELEHANAMTYDSTNGLIYVSACNKVNDSHDGTVDSNRIYILDYTTLSIQGSFVPSNIPVGGRIRSVTYDNDNNKLYAGDVFSIYEVDTSTQAVVDTITLEQGNLNTGITNQTFTYLNGKFYGLFLTYLGVWDTDGNLTNILPFNDVKEGKYGEVESITFKDNSGDFVMATATRYNANQGNHVCSLYEGNIYIGAENVLPTETLGADTTNIFLYVDASYTGEQDGTKNKPFTDIAKALTIAKEWNKGCSIYVKAGTYNYVYVNQLHALNLIASEAGVIINGLQIANSNVTIGNGSNITVNYLYIRESSNFNATGLTINQATSGTGYCLRISENSHAILKSATITGTNNSNVAFVTEHSTADFTSCTFAGYAGYYAINIDACSEVKNYNPTMSITQSDTQKLYRVNAQSVIYLTTGSQSEYLADITGSASKYPSATKKETITSTVFYGDVCSADYAFNSIEFLVKICGTNTRYKVCDCDQIELGAGKGICLDTKWVDDQGEHWSTLVITVSSGTIKVNENRQANRAVDGTYTYETLSSNTPGTPKNYSGIAGVKFYNK